MTIFRESLAIFRRNPWTAIVTLLLIIAAALGQVVSLSSLYPILQSLVPDQNRKEAAGGFARLLATVGAAPVFINFLLLFLILSIAYSLLNWAADVFQSLHARKFESAIRQELFETAVRARWSYAREVRHGEFLSVITREVTQYRELIRYLVHMFGAFAQFGALLVFAFYLDWKVTALGVMMFSAGGLVLAPMLRRASALGQEGAELAIHMSNRTIAALRSLKMVKALSLETYLAQTMRTSFDDSASNVSHSNVLASGQYAVMEIIAAVAVSAMLYVGLFLLSIPKAELIVILLLLFRALPLVRLAIDNYHRAYGLVPSVQMIRQHLAAARKAETRRGGTPIPADWKRINFCDVTFAYEDRTILSNTSLSIDRGEFWAIVGPSGIGKTTFLDLLTGLLEPQAGIVQIDGLSLSRADIETWHLRMAYLGQEAFVFSGTVRDNLVWGSELHWTDAQLNDALRSARLDTVLDRNAGENGSNLSGGEKQRLALARLFLRQPSVVILDEPTTGLDRSTERDIFESIFSYFHGTTIIMVTHREELARDADHVIRFSNRGIEVESGVTRQSRG
jgi:ATP-binding cassette, subfamily C, bacterial